MSKTEELGKSIRQAAEDADTQNEIDMGSWEHYNDLLVINVLKACKEAGLVWPLPTQHPTGGFGYEIIKVDK